MSKPLPDTLDDFGERFDALAKEAESFGLNVTVTLVERAVVASKTSAILIHKGCQYSNQSALMALCRELDRVIDASFED